MAAQEIIVVAGPNGAGKTTFAMNYLPGHADGMDYINADLIAAGLSNFRNVYAAAVDDWVLFDSRGPTPVILDQKRIDGHQR